MVQRRGVKKRGPDCTCVQVFGPPFPTYHRKILGVAFCESNCILVQYDPGVKINPLKCRRWSCETCHPARCARLRSEAYRGIPNTFITLTVNPEHFKDHHERARRLKLAWTRVRRKAVKSWGNRKIPFLAVFEETASGEPHLHILARSKWIPQDWLSSEMEAEIGAPVVDIRRIHSRKKAAKYVSKYVGKAPEKFHGTKRYWRSLDYMQLPRREFKDPIGQRGRAWWVQGSVHEVIQRYTQKFYRLEIVGAEPNLEYWLVDDFPVFERGSPKEAARTRRQPDSRDVGLQLGMEWSDHGEL